eukprot:CAMPEP_0194275158 /NCGR_PEP_ID=MMETSP0169-20130528/8066_1 /TAXON_ID=218684 /ORGANISM="Corethron pennatum, Strain L29A3" /LENGTH=90 /DNA_ID=CAMNT_0039018551 /DNA_START=249 /DNA_END=521 /DNA_ORIENTATION=+
MIRMAAPRQDAVPNELVTVAILLHSAPRIIRKVVAAAHLTHFMSMGLLAHVPRVSSRVSCTALGVLGSRFATRLTPPHALIPKPEHESYV